jgi:hypothetical protein
MRTRNYIVLFLSALISTLLDTSFFSNLTFYNASILLTLSLLISLAILEKTKPAYLFAAFAVLCYSVLSSLSVYLLVALFLGIPFLISYLKSRFLIEFNFTLSVLTICAAEVLFIVIATAVSGEFNLAIIKYIGSFTTVNSLATIVVLVAAKKTLSLLRL